MDYSQYLQLEVEVPTAGLPNLVQNPNGRMGTWGWETPVTGTSLSSYVSSGNVPDVWLRFMTTPSQAAYWRSEYMGVEAGKYVTARYDIKSITASHNVRVRFEWYDSTKTLLSTSTQTAAMSATQTHYTNTYLTPANTAYVKIRYDFYNGVSNPSANAYVEFYSVMVTWQNTGTPSTTRTNLVRNPSFEVDTTGWVLDKGTMTRQAVEKYVGSYALQIGPQSIVRTGSNTFGMPVSGGKTYTWSLYAKSSTGAVGGKITWFATNGSYITESTVGIGLPSTTTWGRGAVTDTAPNNARFAMVTVETAGNTVYIDAVQFEQTTDTNLPNFDGSYTGTGLIYAWSGTAHNSTSTRTTSATTFDYSAPRDWQNILGPTHSISINRSELDPGLMSIVLYDVFLDPAAADSIIIPGKKIRVKTRTYAGGPYYNVYEGTITNGQTAYDWRDGTKGTKTTVSATDNVAALANQSDNRVVAAAADLAYVLEGKGVPWSINGAGYQPAGSPTVVAVNENASVLDQVAITRDTNLMFAWVDRDNTLQVKDRPTGSSYNFEVSDQPGVDWSYSDIDVSYNTDDCINSVTVNFLRYDIGTGTTTEVPYGPYEDAASIKKYGAHAKTFTVAGAASLDNDASMKAWAQTVLTASATPKVVVNSITWHVKNENDLFHAQGWDLYSRVAVTYGDKFNTVPFTVTGITHEIDPEDWTVTVTFADNASVATPTLAPNPQIGAATAQPKTVGGTVAITISAAATATTAITYPAGTFTTRPSLVTNVRGSSSYFSGQTGTGDKDGATVFIRHWQGTSATASLFIDWIAYGT